MFTNFSKIVFTGLVLVGFNASAADLNASESVNNEIELSFMDDNELASVQAAARWNNQPETVQAKLPPKAPSRTGGANQIKLTPQQLSAKAARQKARQKAFKRGVAKVAGGVGTVVLMAGNNIKNDTQNLKPYTPKNSGIVFN